MLSKNSETRSLSFICSLKNNFFFCCSFSDRENFFFFTEYCLHILQANIRIKWVTYQITLLKVVDQTSNAMCGIQIIQHSAVEWLCTVALYQIFTHYVMPFKIFVAMRFVFLRFFALNVICIHIGLARIFCMWLCYNKFANIVRDIKKKLNKFV